MIDIEPNVFDEFYTYMTAEYADLDVRNEIIMTPETFPMVCVEEISNAINQTTIDSSRNENYVVVGYEVRAYVNPTSGKRKVARELAGYADAWFTNKGFERIGSSFVTFNDGTKMQCICQYTGITDGETIYRR